MKVMNFSEFMDEDDEFYELVDDRDLERMNINLFFPQHLT